MKNVNVDYPKLPLKAPSRLVVVRIPNVRTHAFFYDQAGKKYYEMCFNGMDHVKKWAKECFNIDPPQW